MQHTDVPSFNLSYSQSIDTPEIHDMLINIAKLRDNGICVDIDEIKGTISIHSMNGHNLPSFDVILDELQRNYGLSHSRAYIIAEDMMEAAFAQMVLDLCN